MDEDDDFGGERGDVDEVVEKCRDDAVIVAVYTEQKISVPFSTIEEMGSEGFEDLTREIAVNLLRNHGLKVEEDFPPFYKPWKDSSYKIIGLGHAGVCTIDGKREEAYYFEFGRYGDASGIVRESDNFGKSHPVVYDDENPALGALESLCEKLRITNGNQPVNFEGIYVKTHCGLAQRLVAKAKSQMPNNRGPYSLMDNHCMTFAIDMAEIAGVDVSTARKATGFDLTDADKQMVENKIMEHDFGSLAGAWAWWKDIDIDAEKRRMMNSIINDLESEISKMVPPSHMMKELQKIWKKLNHAPFDFEGFQERPLQKKS